MSDDLLDRILASIEPRMLALAGGSLLLIGVLAGALYLIKPAWVEYDALRTRHEQARRGADGIDADAGASIVQLELQIGELRDALYGGASAVPRSEIESFVVNSLDRLSTRHGVTLLGIKPDDPTTVLMFEELPYAVRVEGSYFAIHRWLYDVEEELRPMVVKQFDLTPSRKDEGVVLELRIVAYHTPEGIDA